MDDSTQPPRYEEFGARGPRAGQGLKEFLLGLQPGEPREYPNRTQRSMELLRSSVISGARRHNVRVSTLVRGNTLWVVRLKPEDE